MDRWGALPPGVVPAPPSAQIGGVTASAALLALLAAAPPFGEGLVPARPPALSAMTLSEPWTPTPAGRSGFTSPPACSGDVCQPIVAVPGFEPRLSIRGKRTELVVKLLGRARVEPLATVMWALAATGLRVDFTPASFEPGSLSSGHGGWGHLQVLLRWRLDAANGPVWPERPR